MPNENYSAWHASKYGKSPHQGDGMRSEARRNQILDRARELAVTGDYEGWQAIANEMRENEGRCEAGRVLERGHVGVEIDRLCDQANQIRGPHAHKKRVA